jgi:hypothetical protein
VRFNGKTIRSIEPPIPSHISEDVEVRSGWNNLSLETSKCLVPAKISESQDQRCFGIKVDNISFFDIDEGGKEVFFAEGWYGNEGRANLKQNGGELIIYKEKGEVPYINLTTYSPQSQEFNVTASVNGKNIREISLEGRNILYFPNSTQAGRNNLKLETDRCIVSAQVTASEETNCISIFVDDIGVKSPGE